MVICTILYMKRKQAISIYHQLYNLKYPLIEQDLCQYCGASTDLSLDHIPAITTAHLYVRNLKVEFILVKSCMECNQLLSNKLLPTFNSRFFQVKDDLIKKNRKNLINQFRNGMNFNASYLENADRDFFRLIDRIGFGLINFNELCDEAINILKTKIDAYDASLANIIASRFSGLVYHEEEDYGSGTAVSYNTLLQFIKFFKVTDNIDFEYVVKDNSNVARLYGIPEKPVVHFRKSWSEIINSAKLVQIELDFTDHESICNIDEFVEVLSDYKIGNKEEYNKWFQKNRNGLAFSLMMPEFPEKVFNKGWEYFSFMQSSNVSMYAEDDSFNFKLNERLSLLDDLLIDRVRNNQAIIPASTMRVFIEAGSFDEHSYHEFVDNISGHELRVHLPDNPEKHYKNWFDYFDY